MASLARSMVAVALVTLAGLALMGSPVVLAAEPPTQSDRLHRVERGDTLARIARRYSVSVPALVRANQLTPRARLHVGEELAIPSVKRAVFRSRTVVRTRAPQRPALNGPRVRRASRVVTMPTNLVLSVPEFAESAPPFLWPIDGTVSSGFGHRGRAWHRGIDIMAPPGTMITASAPGLVIASEVQDRYGRVVKIQHDGGFVTVYAHNEQNLVQPGESVSAGQKIATVGRTGHATGEHVHFEIRRDGRAYNPLYLLPMPPALARVEEREPDDTDDDE
jgi:murein DD-endopeptidase MepM/ murein hydrolase activator NlpD